MSLIQHNIADLNAAVATYQQLSGKTTKEVLQKQGGKLGREIFFALLTAAPEKGAIRSEILGRLRNKQFIKIRPSVVERTAKRLPEIIKRIERKMDREMWFDEAKVRPKWVAQQEMVRREIAVRESGRRFLAISVKYPTLPESGAKSISKAGLELSNFGIKVGQEGGQARFLWSGVNRQSKEVVAGLRRPVGKRAIAAGIEATRKDIAAYVEKKQKDMLLKVLQKAIKQSKSK